MPVAARIARSFLPQQAGLRASFFKDEAPVLTGKPLPPALPFPLAFPLIFPGPALPAGRQVRPCPTKIRLSGGSLLQLFPTALPRRSLTPAVQHKRPRPNGCLAAPGAGAFWGQGPENSVRCIYTDKEKSEPVSIQTQVRIFLVWWTWRDSNP